MSKHLAPVVAERTLRAAYDAYNRRDWDAFFVGFDPDFEWDVVEENVPSRGRGAVIDYFERWLEPWEEFRVDIEEVDVNGDRVFVAVRTWGRNRGSDVLIEGRFFHVHELRDGKFWCGKEYADRAEARAAAGLAG